MSKIILTQNELKQELKSQLDNLESLCKRYDEGEDFAAKSIATTLRVLLHDPTNLKSTSKSLLGQLNLKNKIYNSLSKNDPYNNPNVVSIMPTHKLVSISIFGNRSYEPHLDDYMYPSQGLCDFDKYWDEIIINDQKIYSFSRKDIVMTVADQDGGAHVDSGIDENYYKLTRENLLGYLRTNSKENSKPLSGIENACIRQIAHEVLKTFRPSYYIKPTKETDELVVKIGPLFSVPNYSNKKKIGRNDKCICGSDIKYKKCHGK